MNALFFLIFVCVLHVRIVKRITHSQSAFHSLDLILLKHLDGQTLPINRRQKAYNNGTLVIEQLQRAEDAGTFTCMAQNKLKQTSRRNVEIQVLSKFKCFFFFSPIHKSTLIVPELFTISVMFLVWGVQIPFQFFAFVFNFCLSFVGTVSCYSN